VILFGEHSVVHGYPALAAGLPRGLVLEATPLADAGAPMHLQIPAWELDLQLDPFEDHPVARACLEVLAHCDGPVRGWSIRGDTVLPARAGLGSSAALSVAIARLVLGQDAEASSIVDASLAGERVFHGHPSGLDSEVSTRGGLLTFVRGEGRSSVSGTPPLPLVVVASGIPRSTAAQVESVNASLKRTPSVVRPLLKALGATVEEGLHALRSADFRYLGQLMTTAHEVLSALGVSRPELDGLCADALHHGALGAKLTGAGGGGSLIVLPDVNCGDTLVQHFRGVGLQSFLVTIHEDRQPLS